MTHDRTAGCALILGSGLYAVLLGAADLTFNLTPLLIGLVVTTAGCVGHRPRLVPIGVTLLGWGSAVVLVRNGPVPDDREAAAFMIGSAVGLLAAHMIVRRRNLSMTGSLLTLLNGGLAFYLAFDITAIGEWPIWCAALLGWGVVELARSGSTIGDGTPSR